MIAPHPATATPANCGAGGTGRVWPGLFATLALTVASSGRADYNDVVTEQQDGLYIGYMLNYVPGMLPGNPFGTANAAAAWAYDLHLKFIPPVVDAPPSIGHAPNNSAPGESERCYLKESVRRASADYSNLRGADLGPVPADLDWYPLTPWVAPGEPKATLRGRGPQVRHRNSDVTVTPLFANAFVRDELNDDDNPDEPAGLDRRRTFSAGESIYLPVGRHEVSWRAQTLLSDALHVPPYWALGLFPPIQRAIDDSAGREFAFNLLLEAGLFGAGKIPFLEGKPHHGVENFATQIVDVYDLTSPTISGGRPRAQLEAIDVGGAWAHRYLDDLREELTLTDECDRPVELRVDYAVRNQNRPTFWPIGEEIRLTWTASDPGPNRDGGPNRTEWQQTIVVEDTKPPLLLPPPHRVVEVGPRFDRKKARVALGNAAVFDLADQNVEVSHDGRGCGGDQDCAKPRFDVDARTRVRWTATDGSGNRTRRNQWVTVKRKGTNTRPIAVEPAPVRATSYEPTEITLEGIDRDVLSGRTDPLSFAITRQPENGFFVSPLLPFFISDYRVENGLSYDELVDRYCIPKGNFYENTIPSETIFEPIYIDVRDDGTTYVLQVDPQCPGVRSGLKISRFDGDGEYFASSPVGGNTSDVKRLRVAPDGNIHVVKQKLSAGGGVDAVLMIYDADLNRLPGNAGSLRIDDTSSARVMNAIETKAGLIYAVESDGLRAYRRVRSGENYGAEVKYLGRLEGMMGFQDSGGQGVFSMALDSEDNLYITGPDVDVVYKFGPSEWNPADDSFVPGELIGWMGRCSGGENCRFDPIDPADPDSPDDPASGHAIGFACTEQTCERAYPTDGVRPGQFHDPRGLGIDPNDNLYITDYDNFRVQRFTSDGFFAGEAKSECDGSCFVLGDFGQPLDISVNSTHFYVLDREFDLLHSFEITPITDIGDDSVTVTYQSDDGYTGRDRFRFAVDDGLLTSATVPVFIDVVRNHRRPLAESFAVTETPGPGDTMVPIFEDVPGVPVTLRGTDRDPEDEPYLVYRIVTPPANGRLKGQGARRTYMPRQDFFGTDSFTYLVSDRKTSSRPEDSAIATVTIDVRPVNDVPVFSKRIRTLSAGLGFPVDLTAELDDIDVGDTHRVVIDWGDGAVDVQAEDIEDGPVVAQGATGAVIMARHTYLGQGQRTARVCVTDAPASGFGTAAPSFPFGSCDDARVTAIQTVAVDVSPMTDVTVVVQDDLPREEDENGVPRALPVPDGSPISYFVEVVNTLPDSRAGASARQPAKDVILRLTLTDHMRLVARPSGCSLNHRKVRCRLGDLEPGQSRSLRLDVELDGTASGDADLELLTRAYGAGPEANGRSYTGSEVRLAFNPEADGDGDGRSNDVDVFPADPGEWRDTDADGIGDNADLDDDDDLMPDAWEERYGLNARKKRDRLDDLDGDGLNNANEFLLGTDPSMVDTDHDSVRDLVDNCPVVFNVTQADLDGDGVGNPCDADFARHAVLIDRVAGNAQAEVAMLARRPGGRLRLEKVDGATGKIVWRRIADFLDGDWTAHKLLARRDRLVVLASHGDGSQRAFVVNANNGKLRDEIDVLHQNWTFVDAAMLPAAGGSGRPGFAVLAINPAGKSSVEIRDLTGKKLARLSLFGESWTPLAVRRLRDADRDGHDDVAVLAAHHDGRSVVSVVSTGDAGQLGRHEFFGDGWRARDLRVLTNVDGKGGVELAVLAQNRRGRIVTRLIDARRGERVAAVDYASDGRAPVQLSGAGPMVGGQPSLTVLSRRLDGRVNAESRSGLSGELVRRDAVLGPAWVPQALLGRADGSRFAVVGTDGRKGVGRLQLRDRSDGTLLRDVILD
jgi:hypothetical protein